MATPKSDGVKKEDRDANGRFVKGSKAAGRRKGKPNKVTRDLMSMIWDAFAQAGGAEGLAKHPEILFGQILPKLLPRTINQNVNANHRHTSADESEGLRLLSDALKATGTDGGANTISFPGVGKE